MMFISCSRHGCPPPPTCWCGENGRVEPIHIITWDADGVHCCTVDALQEFVKWDVGAHLKQKISFVTIKLRFLERSRSVSAEPGGDRQLKMGGLGSVDVRKHLSSRESDRESVWAPGNLNHWQVCMCDGVAMATGGLLQNRGCCARESLLIKQEASVSPSLIFSVSDAML